MTKVYAHQIKAARAMLDWTQDDLASKAEVSLSSVRSLESGVQLRPSTTEQILKAFDSHNIEFTEDHAVRLRQDAIRVFKGRDGLGSFFLDVENTIDKSNTELLIFARTTEVLVAGSHLCAVQENYCILDFAKKFASQHNVQALIYKTRAAGPLPQAGDIELRYSTNPHLQLFSFCLYGDKMGIFVQDDHKDIHIVALRLATEVQNFRLFFHSQWLQAEELFERSRMA